MSVIRRRLTKKWYSDDQYITFQDEWCESRLIDMLVTTGETKISKSLAKSVTSAQLANFLNQYDLPDPKIRKVTSFDELQYFTGLDQLPPKFIYVQENITSITLPETVKYIPHYCINAANLTVHIHKTPDSGLNTEAYSFYPIKKVNIGRDAKVNTIGNFRLDKEHFVIDDDNVNYGVYENQIYTRDFTKLIHMFVNKDKIIRFHPNCKQTRDTVDINLAYTCPEVETIIYHNGIQLISNYSWNGLLKLKTLVFGTGVKSYGYSLFNAHSPIETMVFTQSDLSMNVPGSEYSIFQGGSVVPPTLKNIYVPDDKIAHYKSRLETVVHPFIKPLSQYTGPMP